MSSTSVMHEHEVKEIKVPSVERSSTNIGFGLSIVLMIVYTAIAGVLLTGLSHVTMWSQGIR